MSTSTMRSAPAATPTDTPRHSRESGNPSGVLPTHPELVEGYERRPSHIARLAAKARRGIATVLFGADAANALDSRDVDSYFRTTEG